MNGSAYPRTVRQMLIRTSTPQPATRATPTGGTGRSGLVCQAASYVFACTEVDGCSQRRVTRMRRMRLHTLAMFAAGLAVYARRRDVMLSCDEGGVLRN